MIGVTDEDPERTAGRWASASIEFEHQPQRLVHGRTLVDRELADEVPETFWGDSGRLLHKHLRWFITDFDPWPKDLWCRR